MNNDAVFIGYVIRITTYKESDAIVTILSKDHGQITFKAKSILKPTNKNSSACQLYTLGEYSLTKTKNSDYYILKTASVIASLPSLFHSIYSSLLLAFVAESILRIDDFDNVTAFHLFDTVFKNLQTEKTDFLTAVLVMIKYDIQFLGMMLEANSCVNCGTKKNIMSVDYQMGGFLCKSCSENDDTHQKSPSYLKAYRYIMLANIENISEFVIDASTGKEILRDIMPFLDAGSGIRFKSLKIIADYLKVHL